MDVRPFLHQHCLLYEYHENQEATCDKCNQQIHGFAYNCESCQFWLHLACAKEQLPPEISHPLHSQHSLTLCIDDSNYSYWPKGRYFVCQGCFNLSNGHQYICQFCYFVIDVLCASNNEDDVLEKQGRRSDGMYYDALPRSINHFIHPHSLIPFRYRKVNSSDIVTCRWCDKFLSGMCYGCFDWCCAEEEFFVHESCLHGIPTRILKHPFHPTHPLYIQPADINFSPSCNACRGDIKSYEEGKAYHCRKCEFWLHFFCAKRAHQPSLKHDFHEHSLSYFVSTSYIARASKCNFCSKFMMENDYSKWIITEDQLMSDHNCTTRTAIYRCVQCDVNLHLGCVPVPLTTKHGYHRHALRFMAFFIEDDLGEYYCDICEEERNQTQLVYCCKECKYVSHIQCALNKVDSEALVPKSMEQEETGPSNAESDQSQLEIDHFNHPHLLQYYEVISKKGNFRCEACYFEITSQAYGCKSCKYYLHKTCAQLSHEVLYPLHPQHTLKLIANTRPFMCCQCRDFTIGYIYRCYPCAFTLDVKCAISTTPKNESRRLKDIERESTLCFRSQHHKLSFLNFMHQTCAYMKCSICWQPISGPTYTCDSCGYVIHESCSGLFPKEIQLPILQVSPLHPIIIEKDFNQHCCVCRRTVGINSISYRCSRLPFYFYRYFHLQCAYSLRRSIEVESHEHPLFYLGPECQKLFASSSRGYIEDPSFECNKCKNPCDGVPFFRCLVCKINLHLKCVPILDSIKSRCHIHPFSLKECFAEDDSGEYYCDVCEEERNPADHVYYCEECHGLFVAHIECAFNQVEGRAPKAEASSNWQSLLWQSRFN